MLGEEVDSMRLQMHKQAEDSKARFDELQNECRMLRKSNENLRNEQKIIQNTLNETKAKLVSFGQRMSKAEEISNSLEGAVRILDKQCDSLAKNSPAVVSEKFATNLKEHSKYIAEIIKYIHEHHQ